MVHNWRKKKKIFLPSSTFFFIPRSPRTTRKNRTSPNNGIIKKFFLSNLNILTYLTKKKRKFQNRSQKNSQSCVPLRLIMPIKLAAPQTSSFHRSPDSMACMWIVEPCSPVKMSRDSIHKLNISLHCCQHPARIFGDGNFFSHREEDLKRKGKVMNVICCYIQPITKLPIWFTQPIFRLPGNTVSLPCTNVPSYPSLPKS